MPIDLIAFDLDGTALNHNHEISKKNYRALRKAHELGIKLVPCTGRAIFELPNDLNRFIDEFGFSVFPYLITENGAQVFEPPQKKLLYTKSIPLETALALLYEGRKRLALTYASFGIQGATDNQGLAWETEEAKPYIRKYKEIWDITTTNIEELIEWNGGIIKAVISFLNAKDYDNGFRDFSAWTSLSVSSAWKNSLDIMAAGVSKGEALAFVSQHSGISLKNTMAIGDNLNDVEMILQAGIGVAMGNAIEELKKKALWVTGSNKEDGLAQAIEKVLGGH